MKRFAHVSVYVLVIILMLAKTGAAEAALSDCIDATCRITAADGSRGTGCVFEISRDRVYVLTAAHVVGKNQLVHCEFWQEGHRSRPLPGRVITRVENDRCDAAVVALASSQFGGRLPSAVPVAPPDYVLRPGATITSVGCAHGSWSTGFKGHALGYRAADLCFAPTPADGRSGSAIFDADGKMIVGLLRARATDGSEGIACSLQSLYAALGRSSGRHDVQCGPGGCPSPQGNRPQYRFLPYRQEQEWRRQQSPQPVWPTLPAPAPSPASPLPAVDLGPIGEKLDTITDLLWEMRADRQPTPAVPAEPPPPPEPPQPAVDTDALDALRSDIEGARAETGDKIAQVHERLDKTQNAVEGLGDKLKEWIVDHGSLRDRIDARLEKVKEQLGEEASNREIRIAYLKDLIREKLADHGMVGMLGALGLPFALVVAAFLLRRDVKDKIATGDPLAVEKLWMHVGDLRERLHGRLRPDEVPPPEPAAPKRGGK